MYKNRGYKARIILLNYHSATKENKMSTIINFLCLVASAAIATAATVQGACQVGQNFPNQNALYANVNACAYPTGNLNQSCVNASCPALATSGTCPLNSDGSVNTASLMSQINLCLSTMTTVCGGGWGPLILPQMGLAGSLPANLASYTCSIPAGGAMVNGFQQTTIDSISAPNANTLTLTISSTNLIVTSPVTCAITALTLAINNIPFPFNATMTKVYKGSATIALNVNPLTVSQVSTTGSTTAINVNLIQQQPQSGGLLGVVTKVLSLPAIILNPVLSLFASVAAASTDATAFIPFVTTYAGLVYQILLAKCPSG